MTTHYNTSSDVALRCDGDHEWGDAYLSKSDVSTVLKDGEIYLEVTWLVMRSCTNEYTNNVKNAYTECQKTITVDRGSELIPVHDIDNLK